MRPLTRSKLALPAGIALGALVLLGIARSPYRAAVAPPAFDTAIDDNADRMVREGRQIFRFDTFGDEAFWTDTLRMHQVVQGVSPKTALAVGLKVDVAARVPDMDDSFWNWR